MCALDFTDHYRHPALFLVDGVSSICALDFRMDEWGIDVALTGSQKAFSLPLWNGDCRASPKALEATKTPNRQSNKECFALLVLQNLTCWVVRAGVEMILKDVGYPVKLGSGVAAACAYLQNNVPMIPSRV
ncbi:hypothetical protein IFM89_024272 [Coptis chinensis]|uniref:Uncharacterized protein n=1 Tax=Coptis chinensis TaxID=261450 RepID=A0A835HPQ8_9MAGN|nr:hypothetical protein IFM89_024272 [Coptis chinensis]